MKNFWGDDPEGEEDYYAANNIRSTKSFFTSPSTGLPLFTRSWLPSSSDLHHPHPRGLVFMVHGYGNDISWTFQSTPIFLARRGFACFALDLPGHGRSYGLKAFVPDLTVVLDDCIAYFNSIFYDFDSSESSSSSSSDNKENIPPCFLFGESMGGAICLLIHLRSRSRSRNQQQPSSINSSNSKSLTTAAATSLPNSLRFPVRGAVLVAPMCKISDRIRPRWPIPTLLTLAATFFPTLPVVPTADLLPKSVRVHHKRLVAAANPMRYAGRPRLGTVTELLRATDDLAARLTDVTVPFIVLHGTADEVTEPEVSRELYDKARSEDKSMRMYEGMMHSLLFGETDDNVETVRRDILAWLDERCISASTAPPTTLHTSDMDSELMT